MTSMMASVAMAGEITNFNLSERAMKRNLAYILGVLFVMTSCVEEKVLDNIIPTPGEEVEFTAGLNTGVQTKTLYGADNGVNAIKVKWVNGDKVMVYGTTCTEGSDCQVAEYQVSTSKTSTPNTDDGQNVADGLDKTGDIGVRWGSAATSDFVAVYPSENASFTYNSTSKVVTATTSIDSTQNYVFNDEPTSKTVTNSDGTTSTISVWEGTHFANDATDPSMSNAIMYARTDDVPAGDPVGLSFKPFSTVLKFRFMGFDSNLFPDTELYIQNIKITAPKGYHIAGDFDMTIPRNEDVENNPVTATSKNNSTNTNTVTINTIKSGGSYLKLAANQAVEFNVFTVPLSGLKMTSTDLWTVTIQAQGYEPWVYNMIPTATGGYTLVPGLIHKVKVPQLVSKKEVVWNPENWITQIPVPVYISELSVPGAWYCTNEEYQSTTDLPTQYKAGIRAFNIDCRLTYKNGRSGDMDLYCAGSEGSLLGSITSEGKTVLKAMQEIAALIPEDEYVVVVLTIAEKPKEDSGSTLGTVDPKEVLEAIATLLTNNGSTLGVYGFTEATKGKTITADTTIDDVLDHMIVKVNANTIANAGTSEQGLSGVTGFLNYTTIPNTLISYASMAPASSGDIVIGVYDSMQTSPIFWGKGDASLAFHYHQAQRTTYSGTYETNEWSWDSFTYVTVTKSYEVDGVPTYDERKAAIDDIIAESKDIYDAGTHNAWFQIGIGGSRKNSNDDDQASSRTEVAERLNPYLYGKIVSKMDTDPSPVGIVLMNYCTEDTDYTATVNGTSYTASSQDLVKAIIEMNGKFYLKRQGGSIITGDGDDTGTTNPTPAPAKNAAYAVVGDDAF